MRKQGWIWTIAGFFWTVAAGTALHFVYEWSGQSPVAAAFSAVNESTWEHMKLLVMPLFVFSAVEFWFADRPNFLAVRGITAWVGALLIPVLYYTYTGVLGRHVLWLDIAVFVAAAAAAFALDHYWGRRGNFSSGWQQLLGFVLLWGLVFLFVWFTYRTPELALFQDPVTGGYGLPG